jgi:hypothetical protein
MQEKIIIEFDRDEAIAVVDALASSGDSVAERISLVVRNALGDTPQGRIYDWVDADDNEFRIYQGGNNAPEFMVRGEDGWDTCYSLADGDFTKVEYVLLNQLAMILLGDGE